MDIASSLAIVTLAALVHASFQLSVSVLTLLSGHAIGAKHSQARIMRLTFGFVSGVGIMTLLALSFISLVFLHLFGNDAPEFVWAIACGLLIGVGLAVWFFYYRREKGTSLWIPRSFARHLSDRSKATTSAAESFSLGLTSVIGELLFIAAPMIISALVLVGLPAHWQLVGIAIYTVISLLTLFSVWVLIGSGHKLSSIQKWREDNKGFLQFAAGGALVILGFFVYVCKIMSDASGTLF
jgi:divalent metal cation (Fe/Co/Zn/Cd) transporter